MRRNHDHANGNEVASATGSMPILRTSPSPGRQEIRLLPGVSLEALPGCILRMWTRRVAVPTHLPIGILKGITRMPFPKTIEELVKGGYEFDSQSTCRGCRAAIAFYRTPKGKHMPLDIAADGSCQSHFATCPNAKEFRRRDCHATTNSFSGSSSE